MKDQIIEKENAFLVGKRRDILIIVLFILAGIAVWYFFGVDEQDKKQPLSWSEQTSTLTHHAQQDGHAEGATSLNSASQASVPQSNISQSGSSQSKGSLENAEKLGSSQETGSQAVQPHISSQTAAQSDLDQNNASRQTSAKSTGNQLQAQETTHSHLKEGPLQDTYAEVVYLKGTALKYTLKGKVEPVKKGSQFYAGERITTEPNSSLTLRFADQSTAIISAQSEVLFEEIQGSATSSASTLKLTKGQLESRVAKQKGFGAKYEVRTPAMQLAVRGTVFETSFDPETKTSRAVVLEGVVEASQGQQSVELNQGFGLVVHRSQASLSPSSILSAPTINPVESVQKQFPLIFGWNVLSRVSQYQLQLFAGKNADQLVLDKWYRGNIASINGLSNGDYLLRVRGVDKNGLGGFYGETRFTLDVPPIPMMTLDPVSPSRDKTTVSLSGN